MSDQGNIVVWVRPGIEQYAFTTGRWVGETTPKIVQDALKLWGRAIAPMDRIQGFLHEVSHHPSIDRPIKDIGNADVPTITVDFEHCKVRVTEEWGTYEPLGSWTFEQFLTLDLDAYWLWKHSFTQGLMPP